jgi:glycerol-3-phosphate dehydrogenase
LSDRINLTDRAALFAGLDGQTFDVAVIGGGITGAGVARDAAMRGLRVVLLEARDFAAGTSSRSTKLIHGGIRYLAQGDVGLVHEAAIERTTLNRIAPHLARRMHVVLPAESWVTYLKLRIGVTLFEALGRVARRDRHESWDVERVAREVPSLRRDHLVRALVYTEYLTDDARLTVANVRGAHAAGATVATRRVCWRLPSRTAPATRRSRRA